MKSDATSSSLNYCFLYSELPFHFVFLSTKSSKVKLSFSAFVILQTRMTYNQQKILSFTKIYTNYDHKKWKIFYRLQKEEDKLVVIFENIDQDHSLVFH